MALIQRITTRWVQRVGTWIASAVRFVRDVASALFGISEGDKLSTKGKKSTSFVIRRIAYFVADHYLTALSAMLVGFMKHFGFSFATTFVAMWIFDIVVAGAFIAYFKKTGQDLSLGEDMRRAADTAYARSRIMGLLALAWVILLSIVWTGPERVVIFFRKEIGTTHRMVFALAILTMAQALIWTKIYGFGYDALVR
jgi:hypothetical protein